MSKADDKVLDAMRSFRERAQDYWQDTYDKALEDIEFCVNKEAQWDPEALRSRKEAKRPILSINKIMPFVKQQVNALRANKLTLNAIPVDDTDVAKADIQDSMLEYVLKSSRADIATDWAYERAVMGGFGFWRITTEYANHKAFNQDIRVKRIENPQSTYLSPEIKDPTGADATEALTGEWISKADFKRQFPNHEPTSADSDYEGDWESSDTVFVAEYYRIEHEDDTLYQLSNGSTVLKSELEEIELSDDDMMMLEGMSETEILAAAASMKFNEQLEILDERETQRKRIMWYKCSRDAILDQTEIKADFIPIVLVVGDEQWIENRRYWLSMIVNAKDPQILYNYARTAQAEQLHKSMNRPWVADARAIEGYEGHWGQATTNPNIQFLPYRSTDENGQQFAPPFLADVYQGSPDLMRETLTASDEIKATTGIHDASLGSQGNETSGKAIMARQRQGDQANYHFLDNFKRSYEQGGRVILSMIPHIYDTQRVLRITQDDVVFKTLVINVQQGSQAEQKHSKELDGVEAGLNGIFNDVTVGQYDIRIASGADYNTQREEAREVLIELGRAYPQLMEVAGDHIIKAFDFPDADKIAERLKLMLPPQLQQDDEEQGDIPPELQQQIMQMQQQMQQAEQALQQATAELADKSSDREIEVLLAEIKQDTEIEVAKIRESGRTDQEEIKAFSSVLQTILDRTADLQEAMAQMQNAPQDWSTQGEDLDSYTSNDEPMQPQPDMIQEPMPDDMMMPEQGFDEQQPIMPEQMPMGDMPQDFEQPMADMPPDEGML